MNYFTCSGVKVILLFGVFLEVISPEFESGGSFGLCILPCLQLSQSGYRTAMVYEHGKNKSDQGNF